MKKITIRFPLAIWKKLNLLRIDGKIASIQQAVLDGLDLLIESKG